MFRFLKKFLLYFTVFVALSLAAIVGLGKYYEKEVKQFLIAQLNTQLASKVEVGDINFSVLQNFPYASLNFEKVKIFASANHSINPPKILLQAQSLQLAFKVWDIVEKKYIIQKLLLKQGYINIAIDSLGTGNYSILKNNNKEGGDFKLALNSVQFSDVSFNYTDEQARNTFVLGLEKLRLNGDLSSKSFNLNTEIQAKSFSIINQNFKYSGQTLNYSGNLFVDKQLFTLKNNNLQIENAQFEIDGIYNGKVPGNYRFNIFAPLQNLENIVHILPKSIKEKFTVYKISGEASCHMQINSTNQKPTIAADMLLKKGRLSYPEYHVDLADLNFKLSYRKNQTAEILSIPSFTCKIHNKALVGRLLVQNPSGQQQYSGYLNGALDLALINTIIPVNQQTIKQASGELQCALSFSGRGSTLPQLKGNIKLVAAQFILAESKLAFKEVNTSVKFNGSEISIENAGFKIPNAQINLNGKLNNIYTSNFALSKVSGQINIYIPEWNNTEIANKPNAEKTNILQLLDELPAVNYAFAIGKMKYQNANFSRIKGQLIVKEDKLIQLQNLELNAFGGSIKFNGNVFKNKDSLNLYSTFLLKNIALQPAMADLNNFGQTALLSENIKGVASANSQIKISFDKYGNPNWKSMLCKTELIVENGQLINYAPLQGMSRFIKEERLKTIYFSTLHNEFNLQNGELSIPAMDIKSSALNLSTYGTYKLDNSIDFHFKILLSDLKNREEKEVISEFGTIEKSSNAHTAFFIKMNGTIDKPHFAYDKSAVADKIKMDLQKEKTQVLQLIRKEWNGENVAQKEVKNAVRFDTEDEETNASKEIKKKKPSLEERLKSRLQKEDSEEIKLEQ